MKKIEKCFFDAILVEGLSQQTYSIQSVLGQTKIHETKQPSESENPSNMAILRTPKRHTYVNFIHLSLLQ